MQLINTQILLIELCIFLIISTKKQNTLIRFLSETNSTNITNSTNSTQSINSSNIYNSCNKYLDCFNCTNNPSCKWEKEKDSCIPFYSSNNNYSLPILSKDNNNLKLFDHVNFIRKACFMPFNPYIENNNYLNYNNISLKYCGPHYIINNGLNIRSDFKLEINNINGTYGTPNLLCEFIFLTGPSFYVNIEINEEEINNFYLLYSKDSLNFIQYINSSTSLYIDAGVNKLNTFVFYGLKSFDKSPFAIKYKENYVEKAREATGYIMIALGCVIIIILIFAIIFLRKKLTIFRQKEKTIISDDNEKLKNNFNKKRSDETLKEKITKEENSKFIYNFSPLTNTPTPFLKKAFQYNCSICNKMFDNKDEMKKAKCGHFYHISCFNKLIEKMNNLKVKEIKCVICEEIINI